MAEYLRAEECRAEAQRYREIAVQATADLRRSYEELASLYDELACRIEGFNGRPPAPR